MTTVFVQPLPRRDDVEIYSPTSAVYRDSPVFHESQGEKLARASHTKSRSQADDLVTLGVPVGAENEAIVRSAPIDIPSGRRGEARVKPAPPTYWKPPHYEIGRERAHLKQLDEIVVESQYYRL
jgi:hypothetical protein